MGPALRRPARPHERRRANRTRDGVTRAEAVTQADARARAATERTQGLHVVLGRKPRAIVRRKWRKRWGNGAVQGASGGTVRARPLQSGRRAQAVATPGWLCKGLAELWRAGFWSLSVRVRGRCCKRCGCGPSRCAAPSTPPGGPRPPGVRGRAAGVPRGWAASAVLVLRVGGWASGDASNGGRG